LQAKDFMPQEVTGEINRLLEKMCKKLSKGGFRHITKGALNYSVNAKVFKGRDTNSSNEVDLIKSIFGAATVEIDGIEESNLSELICIVKEGFEYEGDEGSYPNQKFLLSTEFELELNQILEQLEIFFSTNSRIFKFWFKDGHPFYPVFWDYAFLVKKDEGNFVLIGSSSD
jgi:hypothetical protein